MVTKGDLSSDFRLDTLDKSHESFSEFLKTELPKKLPLEQEEANIMQRETQLLTFPCYKYYRLLHLEDLF